jgi:hypothetical protein
VTVLLSILSATCSAPAPARRSRDQMLGAWDLWSRTVTGTDGHVIADPILGAQPVGRLFYDASGGVGLQMMREGRQQAISAPDDTEQAKNARVVLGYDSYFGTYRVDELPVP